MLYSAYPAVNFWDKLLSNLEFDFIHKILTSYANCAQGFGNLVQLKMM